MLRLTRENVTEFPVCSYVVSGVPYTTIGADNAPMRGTLHRVPEDGRNLVEFSVVHLEELSTVSARTLNRRQRPGARALMT
jgi:phospholipid N-methyltransferase